jgi:hypothetical protein
MRSGDPVRYQPYQPLDDGQRAAQPFFMPPLSGQGEYEMNQIPSVFRVLGVVTFLLALGALGKAQAQTAAPAASPVQSSFCGSQPLCYEASDFAATITDFRTSTSGGYKLIDVIVRFQNKTNQPLILGYLVNSGTALDDRGNRYIVYGANGFRGIGQVYGGTSFDPKFNLRAGGYGDAQFELMWAPGQTAYGLTYELNLSVDEINTIEAGQHTLGGEFPLHYRGLTNGVSSAAPGQATAFMPQGPGTGSSLQGLPPCGTAATALGAANSAGGQLPTGGQAPAGTNAAVQNAASVISNFGSLFGKKKTAAPAVTNAASTAPCAPAATGGGNSSTYPTTSATTPVSAGNGAALQPVRAASTTTATPTPIARTATTAKPVAAVAKTPAPQSSAVKKPVATPAAQKPAPVNQ